MHGGAAKQVRAAGRRNVALAAIKEQLTSLGGSIDVDPAEAMLAMVREAAWNVAYLRELVSALRGGVDDAEGQYVLNADGVAELHPSYVGAQIAVRLAPDDWRADPHVLVKMYNDERDRLVKFAKLCRDAGVQERQVQIAEEQGRWLATVLDLVLDQLNLTEAQRDRLPAIMGRVVAELEGD
jgi:hypothetical protein